MSNREDISEVSSSMLLWVADQLSDSQIRVLYESFDWESETRPNGDMWGVMMTRAQQRALDRNNRVNLPTLFHNVSCWPRVGQTALVVLLNRIRQFEKDHPGKTLEEILLMAVQT